MKKTAIGELQINTSHLVRKAAESKMILIFASTRKLWNRMPRTDDSIAIISEDRER